MSLIQLEVGGSLFSGLGEQNTMLGLSPLHLFICWGGRVLWHTRKSEHLTGLCLSSVLVPGVAQVVRLVSQRFSCSEVLPAGCDGWEAGVLGSGVLSTQPGVSF